MSRVLDLWPIVRRYAKRFARSVNCDPDDCAQAAILRVIEILNEKPDVPYAYLWKAIKGQVRRTAFETQTIRVPGGTKGAKRKIKISLPKEFALANPDELRELCVEAQLVVAGFTKTEICERLHIDWETLHRRLRIQCRQLELVSDAEKTS